MWRVSLFRYVLLALAGLSVVSPCFAQPAESPPPAEPATEVSAVLRERLRSPRETMKTFFDPVGVEKADCLDLSQLSIVEDVKQTRGPELAAMLHQTIDRMLHVSLELIPDDADYPEPYSLGEQAVHVTPEERADIERLVISRSDDGLWRFSADSVAAIEELYSRWKDHNVVEGIETVDAVEKPFSVRLEEMFPASLQSDAERKSESAFYIAPYQWICLAIVIGIGFLADVIVRTFLTVLTGFWLKIRKSDGFPELNKVWRPMGLLVQASLWYFGTKLIGLPVVVLAFLLVALKFFAIVAAVWTAFRLVDLMAHVASNRASRTETKFDDIIVPMIARSLKFVAVCIGLLTFAQVYGLPMAGLIGSMGIGAMAVALAAQDTVSNFFGSITVLLDRPFEVGDWVIVESGAEGTVETVGFRSSRIRTFYNSVITVPNSRLTTATVDNMGRRRYRRIKAVLNVEYSTTPEQLNAFCEGIRELIRRHPYTRKDYYHVYFNEFAGSSLNILLYC